MKISDLRIGQDIILFKSNRAFIVDKGSNNGNKNYMFRGKIIAIQACDYNQDDGEFTVIYTDTVSKKVVCKLTDYKANGEPEWKSTFWCFPSNIKFIDHINSLMQPKNYKTRNPKYDNLPHDNNKKQLEARLAPQRTLVGRIMENGYVWYKLFNVDPSNNRQWGKFPKPKIVFDKDSKKYLVETPNGFTKLTKIGKSIALENPEAKNE